MFIKNLYVRAAVLLLPIVAMSLSVYLLVVGPNDAPPTRATVLFIMAIGNGWMAWRSGYGWFTESRESRRAVNRSLSSRDAER